MAAGKGLPEVLARLGEFSPMQFQDPFTIPGFPQDPLRPTVTFTPVNSSAPLPSSLPMFESGLGLPVLAAMRRRRR